MRCRNDCGGEMIFRNWAANLLLLALPKTRFFFLKRKLLAVLGFQIGDGTRLCGDIRIYGRGPIKIGQDAWVGLGCLFYSAPDVVIEIGSYCDIAPGVRFVTGSHEIGSAARRAGPGFSRSIEIGDGTWIGAGSIILGGARIGSGCVVAAGAVVIAQEYPANHLIGGCPAKPIRRLDD